MCTQVLSCTCHEGARNACFVELLCHLDQQATFRNADVRAATELSISSITWS